MGRDLRGWIDSEYTSDCTFHVIPGFFFDASVKVSNEEVVRELE